MLRSPLFWCASWLVTLDLGLGLGLRVLAERQPDAGLVRYFDYGRSIEGKLARLMTLPPSSPGVQVMSAGWLDPMEWRARPSRREPGTDLLVAAYGQSFSNNATLAAGRLDGHLTLRLIGGPGAPLDHSYAALRLDEDGRRADIVVLGILASSVPHIGSMSGLGGSFESPAPFTFPHYSVAEGGVQAEAPALPTLAAFKTAFIGQTPDWHRFKDQLARHDRAHDPLVFDRFLDGSNLVKLMRRGWIAHSPGYDDGVVSRSGFNPDAAPVRTLRALVEDAARLTRARGQRLIVLLEHDQGHGDDLYRALAPTLERGHIEYVSTHDCFSAGDPQNFIADGHYTEAANTKFAEALRLRIRREAASPSAAVREPPRYAGSPTR